MALRQLDQPFPTFTDLDGSPLDAGYVYFGVENDNPETAPITVYYDAALTQAAAQPLRTSNGYVVQNGAPAVLYADVAYSLTVRNKTQALVFYSQSGDGLSPGGALFAANNLSDVASASASLVNLGLTATAAELNQVNDKAPLASPALTGTPTAPTAAAGTNTTQLATAAFVQQETPELSQVQVENPASTVFGQVSGERLSQAVAFSADHKTEFAGSYTITSGFEINLPAVPDWVTEVVFAFDDLQLTSSGVFLILIGPSAGPVTSGYTAGYSGYFGNATSHVNVTTGFPMARYGGGDDITGRASLIRKPGTNKWNFHASGTSGETASLGGWISTGHLTLAGALEVIRVTRSGTGTFLLGDMHVFYK